MDNAVVWRWGRFSSRAVVAVAASLLAIAGWTRLTAPAAGASGSDRWAVLIGISHYQGDTHPTYGGDGDVSTFQTLLQRAGWPADHVLVLTDANATMSNMIGAMQWLAGHSSPSSFTMFHYSGHVCEQGRGPCSGSHKYLWSVDNQLMSDTRFGQIMGGIQGWSWIDIAGCEAAAFDQGLSSSHRFVTASSMADETSYESPSWHESIWTGTLVDQGMLQGRARSDGQPISVQQAVRWAQQQVPHTTAGQPAGAQHPYAVGGTGEWYLSMPNPAQPSPPANPGGSQGSPGSSPPSGGGSQPPGRPPVTCPPSVSPVLSCSIGGGGH
jgi:caspase domain-containing protein